MEELVVYAEILVGVAGVFWGFVKIEKELRHRDPTIPPFHQRLVAVVRKFFFSTR
jgi:hypothetical protein